MYSVKSLILGLENSMINSLYFKREEDRYLGFSSISAGLNSLKNLASSKQFTKACPYGVFPSAVA